MRTERLRDYDANWQFAAWICERVGLRAALDERQQWRGSARMS